MQPAMQMIAGWRRACVVEILRGRAVTLQRPREIVASRGLSVEGGSLSRNRVTPGMLRNAPHRCREEYARQPIIAVVSVPALSREPLGHDRDRERADVGAIAAGRMRKPRRCYRVETRARGTQTESIRRGMKAWKRS